ncbi:hypothetical protein TNCV_2451181 [Trichonephila clavipes]|nr:hypothetical protein TNCV_2451181 [Trichonephila clavipes]
MIELGNSFHVASSPCHTLSTVSTGWRASLSSPRPDVSMGDRSGDREFQGVWQASTIVPSHWTEDVRNVSIYVQITVDPIERYACRLPNGCPKHHSRFRVKMPISKASRQRTVSSEPPDTYTSSKDYT